MKFPNRHHPALALVSPTEKLLGMLKKDSDFLLYEEFGQIRSLLRDLDQSSKPKSNHSAAATSAIVEGIQVSDRKTIKKQRTKTLMKSKDADVIRTNITCLSKDIAKLIFDFSGPFAAISSWEISQFGSLLGDQAVVRWRPTKNVQLYEYVAQHLERKENTSFLPKLDLKTSFRMVSTHVGCFLRILLNFNVQSLTLQHSKYGIGGCNDHFYVIQALCRALVANCPLRRLEMSGDWLNLVYIASALAESRSLTHLKFRCKRLTAEAINLERLILRLALDSSITHYDFSGSVVGVEEADSFAQLLSHSPKIESLDMGKCGILDLGCKDFAKVLRTNKTLKKLGLSYNGISASGAVHLRGALLQNQTLTSLDLSDNRLEDLGALFISRMLQENNTLKEINLARNNLTQEGGSLIFEALKTNHHLRILNLRSNNLSYGEGLNLTPKEKTKAITELFQENKKLEFLNIVDNTFGPEEMKYFEEIELDNHKITFHYENEYIGEHVVGKGDHRDENSSDEYGRDARLFDESEYSYSYDEDPSSESESDSENIDEYSSSEENSSSAER